MGFRGIFEEDEKERASRRNSLASETMFAFVDETGNTGSNIFDEKQPDFLTAALITRSDFDLVQRGAIAAISRKIGVKDLHGKELGFQRIEPISGTLLKIFKSSNAHFFVSRVEKRYLLATKIFDTLFDSGENAAVAWHHYNLRPLRIILAFKVASIVDYETAQLFWYCLTERNQKKAYARLPEVCEMLMRNVGNLPDARFS